MAKKKASKAKQHPKYKPSIPVVKEEGASKERAAAETALELFILRQDLRKKVDAERAAKKRTEARGRAVREAAAVTRQYGGSSPAKKKKSTPAQRASKKAAVNASKTRSRRAHDARAAAKKKKK